MSKIDKKAVEMFIKIDTYMVCVKSVKKMLSWLQSFQNFYRCTNCGHDTKQHVNGRIRYMSLTESDKNFIKEHYKNG